LEGARVECVHALVEEVREAVDGAGGWWEEAEVECEDGR